MSKSSRLLQCNFILLLLFCFSNIVFAYEELEILKDKVIKLEERLKNIEHQKNNEKKIKKTQEAKMKAYWKNGFRIEYNDPVSGNEYKFRFRTGIQLRYTFVDTDDNIFYNNAPTGKEIDHTENFSSFNVRRLRFYVDGTAPTPAWKYYLHLQLEPQGGVNTHDGFIQWQEFKTFRIQFGRMKIPALGIEYWQSGFGQNGTDRTIFTGDSECDKDLFGCATYDFPGSNSRLRAGNHRLENGFSTGGFLLYRSQGLNINGYLDLLDKKDFFTYWVGIYNGRDTRGSANVDDEMLYTCRFGMNFLPGSDPKGPMGPNAFSNYTSQGDYAFNTKPLGAFITSAFWDKDQTSTLYGISNNSTDGFMKTLVDIHDIANYGYSAALLFRYLGFSADLEYAMEKFKQEGTDHKTWDRLGFRLNLGYFILPEKWELTVKLAYVERLKNNNLEDSIKSGLGLVKLTDGFVIEDNLQQFILGVNYYLHGFNQYMTADLCLNQRKFKEVSSSSALALGLAAEDFSGHPDNQNDLRVRVMYQFLF